MEVNHLRKRCLGTGYLRRMEWREHTLGGIAVVATQWVVWESKWQFGRHVQRGRDRLHKKTEQTSKIKILMMEVTYTQKRVLPHMEMEKLE